VLEVSGCSRAHREALWINAEVEQCPSIQGVTALPLEVLIDGEIALSAKIPEDAMIRWSAPAGSFSDPDDSETRYRCEAPGAQTLTLTISEDSPCEFSLYLEVTCSTSPLCGNGRLDVGEQCDDGNRDPGDGCTGECLKKP
jgi:cysteine-rich repeat protein